MIPNTKLTPHLSSQAYIPFIFALSLGCIPQRCYTTFITLENEEQYATLIQEKKPFVLQFTASWCPACNNIKQTVEEIAQKAEFDTITIARVDVDAFPSLASQHHIKSIPQFLYFNNGNQITIPTPKNFKTNYQGFDPNNPKESLRHNIRIYLMGHNIKNEINDTLTNSYSFKDRINYLVDMIISFIQKIIQSIKDLFN